MPKIVAFLIGALVATAQARADVAPNPMDPTSPTGAFAWIAVIVAVAALILIWRRRR